MSGGSTLEVGTPCWAAGLGFISDHASLGLGGRGMWVCSLPGAGVEENWGKGVLTDRVDWLHKKYVHNGDQKKTGQHSPQALRPHLSSLAVLNRKWESSAPDKVGRVVTCPGPVSAPCRKRR